MRRFALSYYTGVFIALLLLCASVLHYIFPIDEPTDIFALVIMLVLVAALLFAIFAALVAREDGR